MIEVELTAAVTLNMLAQNLAGRALGWYMKPSYWARHIKAGLSSSDLKSCWMLLDLRPMRTCLMA